MRLLHLILFAAMLAGGRTFAAEAGKPNIVFILADDLGVGDLGCYQGASKVPTPNLDALAASGMRFTNAYCPVSVCSPSRYALMTGGYPWRSWKKRNVLGNWERSMIDDNVVTLPGFLKDKGYVTAGFGKWHLGGKYQTVDGKPPVGQGKFKDEGSGSNIDLSAPITGGPVDRGFMRWKGMICSSELLVVDGKQVSGRLAHELYEPLEIPGIEKLPEHKISELLPMSAKDSVDFIGERSTAKDGKPFFLYFAPYVPHIPLAVADEFKGVTKAGDYGDYVHELDHYVGLILAALDKAGLRENTLIYFCSDNGSQWPETGEGHHPNGSLRGGKWEIYEGGVRSPLIVSWKGKIGEKTTSDALTAMNDVLATVADAIGEKLPERAGPDSVSQFSVMEGKGGSPRTELMLGASRPDHALRDGNWKYVKFGGNKPHEALFDLSTDPSESKNLAAAEPERTKAMAARFARLFKEQKGE